MDGKSFPSSDGNYTFPFPLNVKPNNRISKFSNQYLKLVREKGGRKPLDYEVDIV